MSSFWTLLLLALVAVTLVSAQRGPGQFSPPGCGPNSREDNCSNGCPVTCDKAQDEKCIPAEDGCVPACVCFDGYAKNPAGEGCIQQSECANFL